MDPDPRKEIEVDPERGLKWIRIRPDAVDPDPDPKRCLKIISSYFPTFDRCQFIHTQQISACIRSCLKWPVITRLGAFV